MAGNDELDIDVTSASDGAHVVVSLRGEIDMANAPELSSVVTVAASWPETRRVVVNLDAVSFMDSSGISALLLCHRELEAIGIDFAIAKAHDAPLRVLELTGVFKVLSLEQLKHAADRDSNATVVPSESQQHRASVDAGEIF